MPVEDFIISVFCWVEKSVANVVRPVVKLRQRGRQPRLSDAEVITMELVGEFLGYEGDKAIWSYFRRHWLAWFPALGDRTSFLRQASNLWCVKQRLHEQLVAELGAAGDDCHLIDGFPISVCKLARARRSQLLKAEAARG